MNLERFLGCQFQNETDVVASDQNPLVGIRKTAHPTEPAVRLIPLINWNESVNDTLKVCLRSGVLRPKFRK